MEITITGDYGFVSLVVVLSSVLHLYMSLNVVKARKKYKVPYPTLYAIESENKEAKQFNCVQRGHQNYLEFISYFLAMLILGGIKHPRLAAGLGVGYLVARFMYFKGYSTGIPDNRMKYGGSHFLFLIGLVGCTVSFSVSLLSAR